MGMGTYKRNAAFATEETMWKDVILKDKKSVRGYNNLGIYYEQHNEWDKALAHYQQAIAAYARAFGDEWNPLQRATLERKMGAAQARSGDFLLASDHLKQALVYLGKPLPSSRWRVWLTILYEIVAQIGHRLMPRRPRTARIVPRSSSQNIIPSPTSTSTVPPSVKARSTRSTSTHGANSRRPPP